MRPRGTPPTPSARSSPIDPVGLTSIPAGVSPSPSFMMAPLPNCFSICCSASSRALLFSLADGVVVSILRLLPQGRDDEGVHAGADQNCAPGTFYRILHIWAARGKPEALVGIEPGGARRRISASAPRASSRGTTPSLCRAGLAEHGLLAHRVNGALGRELAMDHGDPVHPERGQPRHRGDGGEALGPVDPELPRAPCRPVGAESMAGRTGARRPDGV